MTLSDLINSLGTDLRRRYGRPVFKLPVDAGFTCPNRDGRNGVGGCSFCNNAAFTPTTDRRLSVPAQLAAARTELRDRARNAYFLAYFQAYTNTYAALDELERRYRQALDVPDVVGLAVATRPDCIDDGVLRLLAGLQAQGYEVWLELGLQSAHPATLTRVNRGHGYSEYASAVARARAHGIPVCTHLIIGLPGETPADVQVSLERVLANGVDGLKLHPLHVVKGTELARQWRAGAYQPWSLTKYAKTAADLIERTPAEVIFHRVSGTAPEEFLLAPTWCSSRWDAINAIERELRQRCAVQGSRVPALPEKSAA